MKSYKLSFCEMKKSNNSITEIIVNDGVEINSKRLEEFHLWVTDNLNSDCCYKIKY